MELVWSGTDFPYVCLKDAARTTYFRDAINGSVQRGNIVVDIGSGSGILAMFAAKAGAKKVYAVEIDHLLVESLKKSIRANQLENVVSVVEGDAATVDLPQSVDVLIAEILDTGLMDELQVPVLNALHARGVISQSTKLIPSAYSTFLTLVNTDNCYYGVQILAPKHEWPFYTHTEAGWTGTKTREISGTIEIFSANFSLKEIKREIIKSVAFKIPAGETANAVKISGLASLTESIQVGATNSFNGDKILPIDAIAGPAEAKFSVSYTMGKGLGSFSFERI